MVDHLCLFLAQGSQVAALGASFQHLRSLFQFIRTDFGLLLLKLHEESSVVLKLVIINQVLNFLVFLIPTPLIDLRFGQPRGSRDPHASFFSPVGVLDVLQHKVLHLLRILSISLFSLGRLAIAGKLALGEVLKSVAPKSLLLNHILHLLHLRFELVDLVDHRAAHLHLIHVGIRAENVHLRLGLSAAPVDLIGAEHEGLKAL